MRKLFYIIWGCTLPLLHAQTVHEPGRSYQLPIKMTPYLAGNFGELRPNHFHAGLDFKTQGSEGHPVYAFDEGYVARAAVNAYGYGLVLYVAHPSGLTTVYAHLSAFADSIAAKVSAYQLEHEENNPDISFAPGELPVRRGQQIAKSGNTGSSGGPHVHFEVRDTRTEDFYDPMIYFLDRIADTTPPRLHNLYLYPLGGTACGSTQMQSAAVTTIAGDRCTLSRTLTAWGKVGLGLKAYDYMDGTTNTYGVKTVRLYQEDSLIYLFQENSFLYDERRYTNTLTDYAQWRKHRSMIMKSFRDPGNHLRMIRRAVHDGVIDIDEERLYHFRYELQDAHGNVRRYPFTIRGVRSKLPEPQPLQGLWVAYDRDFRIDSAGCHFELPAGRLYQDLDFTFSAHDTPDAKQPCLTPVYAVGSSDVPLHDYCRLTIDLPTPLSADSSKLYMACLSGGAMPQKCQFIAPTPTAPAALTAEVRELGRYAVREDRKPPVISPVGAPSARRIALRITDAGSGVASWRGTIDGRFVPFVMNAASQVVANPTGAGITTRQNHKIELTVTDRCGNVATYTTTRWF